MTDNYNKKLAKAIYAVLTDYQPSSTKNHEVPIALRMAISWAWHSAQMTIYGLTKKQAVEVIEKWIENETHETPTSESLENGEND
jgi:hypothetical protein